MKSLLIASLLSAAPAFAAEPTSIAANAVNALGIDLLRNSGSPIDNALLSPYSIQSSLAMAYAGADGVTHEEMSKVLHFPKDDAEIHRSFAALRETLERVVQSSVRYSPRMRQSNGTNSPIILTTANRMFGQTGYDFRASFLALVKDNYAVSFEALDFVRNSVGARKQVNGWVEKQTGQRIRDLIPLGAFNELTRLVIVNAIYLKAPWEEPFSEKSTRHEPFYLTDGTPIEVPTMTQSGSFDYAKRTRFSIISLPYIGKELQLLIFLPDGVNGTAELERTLTARLFADCTNLAPRHVALHLPRFKLEPPMLPLSLQLKALGMKTAFDEPRGSADFDRIAPRRRDDYLYISEVFHKSFLSLDENGTEAAAATAAHLMTRGGFDPTKPVELRVDHPFLFAIQHRPSGVCLFLGRVTDPR